MSRKTRQPLRKIIRFSESLKLDSKAFVAAGVLDPIVGVDVKVFIDPQLLLKTKEVCLSWANLFVFYRLVGIKP